MLSASDPCFYESHTHTELCKHAKGSPDEYAAVAARRGLKGMTVTCHSPLPDGVNAQVRMLPEELDVYEKLVRDAAVKWRGTLDVRLGLESDYAPQFVPWLQELHARKDFSYILGSVHPQTEYYRAAHPLDDPREFHRTYYRQLADAAETGLFDCLSHPDLVKNTKAEHWDFAAIADTVGECLDRIAQTGTSMELNTSGLYKRVREFNPGRAQLEMMAARGITVVLGADAHNPDRVGDQFPEALALLRDIGYARVSFYLNRERQDIDIERARQSLRPASPAA